MQCHLNDVHISTVLKFLDDCCSETIHAIQLPDPFNAANPLIIPLQLSSVTSFCEDTPKIHLTAEDPPCDSSTEEYSECET